MTRQILMAAFAASLLSACGVSTGEVSDGTESAEDGSELSTTTSSYVTFRHDVRRCASPMCGGFYVHDVNRPNGAERYVAGLDFSRSGLDGETQNTAQGPDVVLRGRLAPIGNGYYNFRVYDAFRGMPGQNPAAGDTFYKVTQQTVYCVRAPCPQPLEATKLNHGTKTIYQGNDITGASVGQLDQNWLNDRIEHNGALVAGTFTTVNRVGVGTEKILNANQVYVKLPELNNNCPQFKLAACDPGYAWTYTRDENRCILPVACRVIGRCPQIRPGCATDYTAVTWNAGCPTWACDPTFTVAP